MRRGGPLSSRRQPGNRHQARCARVQHVASQTISPAGLRERKERVKAVSQRQFDLAKSDVRFALKQYEAARAAHLSNPDREPVRVELRVQGLVNHRAYLADRRAALARITPVKYATYSLAAGRREARRHATQ